MPNKYVNKVVIGKETKLDLTADTVTPDKLAKGITAHDKSGAPITGTSTKDADTSDATAAVAEVLNGKTFYARGAKMTGTMPNNGEVNGEISTVSGKYTIPMGFHDGSGSAAIDETANGLGVADDQVVEADVAVAGIVDVRGDRRGARGRAEDAGDKAWFLRIFRGEYVADCARELGAGDVQFIDDGFEVVVGL